MAIVTFLWGPYDGCKMSVNSDVPPVTVSLGVDINGREVVYVPKCAGTFVYEPMKACSLV